MKREVDIAGVTAPRRKSNIVREPLRNADEVAAIFGYADGDSVWGAVANKRFPEPDTILPKIMSGGKKAFWKLSTVQKEERRRRREQIKNLTSIQGEGTCVSLQVQ